MNKKVWIIIILAIILIGGGLYFFFGNNTKQDLSSNNVSEESSNISDDDSNDNNDNGEASNNSNTQYTSEKTSVANSSDKNIANMTSENKKDNKSETEIASFSTKIYTKDSERQHNIGITCSSLNNTDVAPGSTFSFTKTIGPSTSSKGYQEADIFRDGKKTKGLGGGNCQVSTTLYNAVLKVNGLSVTERHEHSNDVPYIQNGKDAAVSYGSYDFKFVNNLDYTVRIKASNSKNNVTIKLVKLSE